MTRWMFALLAAWLAYVPLASAVSEEDLLPIDQAFALSVSAPERGRIEVHWKIAEGYYLYRHRMGVVPLGSGFKFNPLELPAGKRYTDEFFGEVETYRDSVTAVLTGAAADGLQTVDLEIRYQGCADLGVCYPPHKQTLSVTLPANGGAAATASLGLPGAPASTLVLPGVGGGSAGVTGLIDSAAALPEDQAFRFEAIAQSPTVLLLRFTPAKGYYLYRDRSSFSIAGGDGLRIGQPAWPPATPHVDDHFGEVAVYFEEVEVPLPLLRTTAAAQTMTLQATFQGCQTDGICYPPMTRQAKVELPAADPSMLHAPDNAATSDAPDATGVLGALLFALLGGLILNLMPCVLPVLSLKVLGVAGSGENAAKARAHALWYTAGVLVSFALVGLAALGLREAGLALGWGFQLQQPVVVGALAMVMFVLGLNLSGVFDIGAGLAGAGESLTRKSGPAGDFFTGVLAVVVATPCTAPFMGGALAFAFTAPTLLAVLVFLALGLGLALPFLLIGFVPALAGLLPRPGAWMNTFKQALAFPMYLTAVWLVWVLGKQRGIDASAALLVGFSVLAAGLWLLGRLGLQVAPLRRTLAVALILLGLGALWVVHGIQAPATSTAVAVDDSGSVAYSASKLDALRGEGRVVFVNMTADWCVTCKANEKAVLATDHFRALLEETGAVYMKGDWTNVDPEITRFLESHGAYGVPLYVVYRPGAEPLKLPAVLSDAIVDEALRGPAD